MKERSARHLLPLFREAIGDPSADPVLSFYRYVGTKSTIRERNGRLFVRISDHLEGAPVDVLRGLFAVLWARFHGRPEPRDADRAAYDVYVASEAAEARRDAIRARRGRKQLDPVGEHRSLLESYLRVVMETGLSLPSPPRLSWSPTASRRRFGHQDTAHDCIVISRILDDETVPEFVLDFVVYHELLHIVHPPIQGSGTKRIIHHRAFRDAEAGFPRRDEAESWLTRLARTKP